MKKCMKYNTLRIILINLLFLLCGLVLIEIFLGSWFGSASLKKIKVNKNSTLVLNVDQFYKTNTPIIKYSRDKYGFRGTYISPSDIDIVTVGGSTTQQLYLADGETWQDALKFYLAQDGINVNIVNAGVGGQSTFGHIENFKHWFSAIPDLKPKFFIFYVGINDFYRFEGHQWDNVVRKNSLLDDIKSEIRDRSILINLKNSIIGTYRAMIIEGMNHTAVNFAAEKWTKKRLLGSYDFMQPHLNNYADRLRLLADLTYKFGSKPIFVSQPARKYRVTTTGIEGVAKTALYNNYLYNGVDYYFMMRKLDSVTKAVANETKAFFIDLSAYTDWDDNDFYDFCHNTPQGAKKIGAHLHGEIKKLSSRPI